MFRVVLKLKSVYHAFYTSNSNFINFFKTIESLKCRNIINGARTANTVQLLHPAHQGKYIPKLISPSQRKKFQYLWLSGILGMFQPKKEEDPESELIKTIKRAVLLIQRDEFKSAEQMLHVALKLAQEQDNNDGVTYIYDLLANLAFAQGQFNKAEKLFVSVMQRLLSGGVADDDLKINHMSLKLAKIYEEKKEYEKAEEGYKYCLKNLQKRVDVTTEDEDSLLLWAMTLDWYARFLLDQQRMDEAMDNFKKAYDMSISIHGEIHEQTVVLLNDLGTISFLKGDYDSAIAYLTKAIEIGKHLPNMEDFSSVYVNLGNIYMQKQMYSEAKKHCKEGWQNATRHKNAEGMHEASVCLEELTKVMPKS